MLVRARRAAGVWSGRGGAAGGRGAAERGMFRVCTDRSCGRGAGRGGGKGGDRSVQAAGRAPGAVTPPLVLRGRSTLRARATPQRTPAQAPKRTRVIWSPLACVDWARRPNGGRRGVTYMRLAAAPRPLARPAGAGRGAAAVRDGLRRPGAPPLAAARAGGAAAAGGEVGGPGAAAEEQQRGGAIGGGGGAAGGGGSGRRRAREARPQAEGRVGSG
jgi:hypothetical protein